MPLFGSQRQQDRIERLVVAIAEKLDIVVHFEEHEMKELDDLTAEVAADEAIETSAVKLINGIAAQIAAAGVDPAKLQALTDGLTTSSTALAAAVAALPPPPAPPPAPPAP